MAKPKKKPAERTLAFMGYAGGMAALVSLDDLIAARERNESRKAEFESQVATPTDSNVSKI